MDPSSTTQFTLLVSAAIQQTVELIDVLVGFFTHSAEHPSDARPVDRNQLDTGFKRLLSFALAAAFVAGCRDKLPAIPGLDGWIHYVVWVVALSAGTDGVNSILKYLTYTKENKKAVAAADTQTADPTALRIMQRK